jgi:hypothetical protein
MTLTRLFKQSKTAYDPTPDDLTILSSGVQKISAVRPAAGTSEADDGRQTIPRDELDYLWYQVEEREAGRRYTGYKVVKLIMLRYLPQDARHDAGLVAKTKTALVGLYNSRARFDIVQVVAGMFDPPIGVMQCYGVATFEPTQAAALEQANLGLAALRGVLANYVQSRFELLDFEKADWLSSALTNMPHALVAIGQPDARQNPRGGGRQTTDEQLDMAGQGAYSLQQNELLFRGLSALNEEFVFLLIAHKINLTEIARMLAGISGEASVWASRTTGVKGISFGLSIPIALSGALARQASTAYADSLGRSASQSIGSSHSVAHTQGTADTVGQATSHGFSHTVGTAHTEGTTTGVADGISAGTAHTNGVSHGTNESWGNTHTTSSGQSVGTTTAHTTGTTVSNGVAAGTSSGHSDSQGSSWQSSDTASQGSSSQTSDAVAHGTQVGYGGGESDTHGLANSNGANVGVSLIGTGGVNNSVTDSLGHGVSSNWNAGVSDGQTHVTGTGLSAGTSQSSGVGGSTGQMQSSGQNFTASTGVAAINTTTTSVSVQSSSSQADSNSHSVGVSTDHSQSDTTSKGTSQTLSTARSSSDTSSESFGESWGTTNSWAHTQSQSDSVSDGQSSGAAIGQSSASVLGQGLGVGSSLGLSGGVIPTLSASKSYNWVDAQAQQVAELYRTQEAILVDASKEGAYLTDVYMLTRTPTGLAAAEVLIRQAFHGSDKIVTSFQTRRLSAIEQKYIQLHTSAFTPSTRIETIPGLLEGYKDSTLLPPEKLAALFALGQFERGPAVTTEERIPPFAFIPDLQGDGLLGKLWDVETHLLTDAPLRLSEAKHMHTAFVGDTGFGKTVAAERLCVEVVGRWHHRAVVLDWGQGWRKLWSSSLPRERVQIYQLHENAVRPLRWNPLQIGRRIGPNAQCEALVDIFAKIGGLGSKQSSFMLRALRRTYIEAGVFTADPEVQGGLTWGEIQNFVESGWVGGLPVHTALSSLPLPALQRLAVERSKAIDLTDWIAQMRVEIEALKPADPSRSALESVVVRMERLTHGASGRRYAKGDDSIAIEDLGLLGPADDRWGVAVLEGGAEMDGYSKSVLLSLIAWHLYHDAVVRRRESIGRSLPALNIFFEEANKIFLGDEAGNEKSGELPPVSGQMIPMFTDGRKYRVYCHPILQAVSLLPPAILSSCVNVFVGQSKGIRDRDAILAHLAKSEKGFTDEEYKRFVSKMPPKMIICKLGYGEHVWETGSMLCQIDQIIATEPRDEELLKARLN